MVSGQRVRGLCSRVPHGVTINVLPQCMGEVLARRPTARPATTSPPFALAIWQYAHSFLAFILAVGAFGSWAGHAGLVCVASLLLPSAAPDAPRLVIGYAPGECR